MAAGSPAPPPPPVPHTDDDLARWVPRLLPLEWGYEGTQIMVEWQAPLDVSTVVDIRVLRRHEDYPRHESDGLEVYSGAPVSLRISDRGMPHCECLFYAIWVQLDTGEWVTAPRGRDTIMPRRSGWFGRKLWWLLPEVYRIRDKRLERTDYEDHLPLPPGVDAEVGDHFNIHEDGGTGTFGQLRRFLEILGLEFDAVHGMAECLPAQFDVDRTCPGNLPRMAELVGLQPNHDLSVPRWREEIKGAVGVYRINGTQDGIAAFVRALTGLAVEVDDTCDNVFLHNDEASVHADSAPEHPLMDRPGDDLHYHVGGDIDYRSFWVYVQLDCDRCLGLATIQKLVRELVNYRAACRRPLLVFLDCERREEWHPQITEAHTMTVEQSWVDDLSELCWLYHNDEDRVHNDRWIHASPRARAICGDVWSITEETTTDRVESLVGLRQILHDDPSRHHGDPFHHGDGVSAPAADFWTMELEVEGDRFATPASWLLHNDEDSVHNGLRGHAAPGILADLWTLQEV